MRSKGATWSFHNRHRRRMRESGRLDDPSPVKPEVWRVKGNLNDRIAGDAGGSGSNRGNSEPRLKPAALKASEARGNPSGDRRHSRRDDEDGANHRNRTPAQQNGSGEGATRNRNPGWAGRSEMRPTRNLIGRLDRSIDDPECYRITVRRRQEPQGFWRFRFWE
jgi:hypothetical protein